MRRWALIAACAGLLWLAGCANNNVSSSGKASSGSRSNVAAATVVNTPKPKANVGQLVQGGTARTGQLAITLLTISDPYTSDNQFTQPHDGNRFVLVDAQLTDAGSHQVTVNPYSFSLATADNHVYNPAIVVTDHDLQLTNLGQGQIAEGAVVFELPQGAPLKSLKYDAGFGQDDLTFVAP